jgi:hypothetical protein
MQWEAIGAVGELVGVSALAIQIRHNSAIAQSPTKPETPSCSTHSVQGSNSTETCNGFGMMLRAAQTSATKTIVTTCGGLTSAGSFSVSPNTASVHFACRHRRMTLHPARHYR